MNIPIHSSLAPAFQGSIVSLTDLVRDLKNTVGQRLTREFRRQLPVPLIRRALDEAAESAWTTGFPHLFFPALAEERVRLVHAAIHSESRDSRTLRRAA
jgi:hypothetical protein